jgi:hypothetical protein
MRCRRPVDPGSLIVLGTSQKPTLSTACQRWSRGWTLVSETCRSLSRTLFYTQIPLQNLLNKGRAGVSPLGVSPLVDSDRVAAHSQMD